MDDNLVEHLIKSVVNAYKVKIGGGEWLIRALGPGRFWHRVVARVFNGGKREIKNNKKELIFWEGTEW